MITKRGAVKVKYQKQLNTKDERNDAECDITNQLSATHISRVIIL